ncbi:MAG: hypothetical protein KF765_00370 [Parvibaculaceae bacterium]|nr:hypothetical protein [Parvibaculaceae bacterium]
MKMKARVLLILLTMPLASACIKGVDMTPAKIARQNMSATVASFEEMDFKTVSFPSVTPEMLSVGDPVFDFREDGMSYFRAYVLPASQSPYILEVTSDRVQYNCAPCTLGIVRPDVLLLDADKKPLKNIQWPEPYINSSVGKTRRYMTSTITPEMGARYAVVYTASRYIGHEEVGWDQAGYRGLAPADSIPIPLRPRYWATGTPVGPMSFVLREVDSDRI